LETIERKESTIEDINQNSLHKFGLLGY